MPTDFLTRWAGWYPGSLPIGHRACATQRSRWLRIHSLPGGRRHSASVADWAELLHRHNEVATAVLGAGAPCTVVVPQWGAEPARVRALLAPLGLRLLARVREELPELADPDDDTLALHAATVRWVPGTFDAVLRARADDLIGPIMFVADASGRAYAPYDGGADLFFPSAAERDAAGERLRAWRSPDDSGL